ncbi:MAG TPA: cytochrome c [Acidiferrobacterales bacterium]
MLAAACAALLGAADAWADTRGEQIYQRACLACHGPDGGGLMPGVPDFTEAGGPLSKSDAALLQSTLEGVQRPGVPAAMPPKGGDPTLTEADLRAVLEYIRRSFAPGAAP